MLGEEMVALADRLDPVTADEAGLATVTRWVGEFMDLHEQWAPVFRSYPDAARGGRSRAGRSAAVAERTSTRLLEAFGLPLTPANRRLSGSLVGLLIRCSFFAEAAPDGS